jgi:hypothetical protein
MYHPHEKHATRIIKKFKNSLTKTFNFDDKSALKKSICYTYFSSWDEWCKDTRRNAWKIDYNSKN